MTYMAFDRPVTAGRMTGKAYVQKLLEFKAQTERDLLGVHKVRVEAAGCLREADTCTSMAMDPECRHEARKKLNDRAGRLYRKGARLRKEADRMAERITKRVMN